MIRFETCDIEPRSVCCVACGVHDGYVRNVESDGIDIICGVCVLIMTDMVSCLHRSV